MSIRAQLKSDSVAIVSVVIALSSFGYTNWRNERSEHNRTIRHPSSQLLTALGEMQQLAYHAHHAHHDRDSASGNPRTGWVYVATINSCSATVPEPERSRAHELLEVWCDHREKLGVDTADADAIADALEHRRAPVVDRLKMLN